MKATSDRRKRSPRVGVVDHPRRRHDDAYAVVTTAIRLQFDRATTIHLFCAAALRPK